MTILIYIGTFFPIIGILLSAVLTAVFRGPWRWIALFGGPMATAGICYVLSHKINFHGIPIFVIQFMFLLLFLIVYYPLIITIFMLQNLKKGRYKK